MAASYEDLKLVSDVLTNVAVIKALCFLVIVLVIISKIQFKR